MKLLREYRFETKSEETFVYHLHLQKLRNRFKLLMNELLFEILIDRINIIYDYRFRLDFAKINVTFTDWFHQDSRFFHFTDSLQLFQLRLHMSQNYKIDMFLIHNMFIKIKYQKWKKNDAIMLSNVFDWILNDNTWVLIKEKLNMYLWHQRNNLDLTNHDWLRTTMYITLQQLVRQNIMYYFIIVTLWLNHEINLLTFSYFMKITFKNNSELIKHVNLNVNDLISDKEQSWIQNTAMFANELINKDDEFILDLHLCMKKWWKEANKRNLATNEYTHCIVLKIFNENDSRRSDLKWVNQSYFADSVRFWMSHLSHDNRDKSNEQRIAMLIYHTAIFKNEVNMKIAKYETKNEVIVALWDQRLINAISSELENNKQERVSFYHSVIMRIQEVCSTSNALIDLWSWNSMKMLKEKSLLFDQNLKQVKEFVEFHWKSALNQMKRTHERMKEAKIAVYESKFYFYCVKNDIKSMKDNEWKCLRVIAWTLMIDCILSVFLNVDE